MNGVNVICPTTATQTFTYTVFNYPTVTVTSSDANNIICYGENVIFTASGATTYEFFVNGVSQGIPTTSNTFSTALLENADIVTAKGYNGNCGSLSANAFTFTVNKMNLNITSSPSSLICQGGSITFTASGANLYQFFVNGIAQGGAGATATFSSSSLSNGSVITFKGTNTTTGCVQLCEFEQYVNVIATPIITTNGSTTFCEGDSLILESSSLTGNQWLLNGAPIANAYDSAYIVKASGIYSVEVSQGGNGTIWSVGANTNGQLGDSTLINSFTPKVIKNITTITDIDAGNEFTIAANSAGSVFVWGDNSFGNLGDGTFTDKNYPYQLPSVSGATAIAAGAHHSLVVMGGSVQAFGNNSDGQLGIGNNGISNFPTAVTNITGITAVSGGEKHSLALKNDGTVWAWGDNQYGQLGDGTFTDRNSPVQVTGLNNVIAISAGKYHSMALKSDSTIWVWGNNAQGQLGISGGTFKNTATQVIVIGKFIAVSAGANHSLALHKTGKVYSWGDNQYGELGDGTTTSHYNPLPINNFSGVKKIKAGVYHNLVIKQDQSVWAWGYNTYGQLGNNNSANASSPVHITKLSGAGQLAPGMNHTSVAMTSTAACSSNAITATMKPAAPVVIYYNVTELSTDPGVSYQWYFNNNPVLGGQNQQQPLLGPGYYMVQVTYANGCTVTSDEFAYIVGVSDLANNGIIHLFPNPATEQFTITYNGTEEIIEMYLTDVVGKKVMQISTNIAANKYTSEVNTESLRNGVYMLCLISKDKMVTVQRIVINK